MCGNKRKESFHLWLLLYRFQFQTSFSVSEHSFSHSYSLEFLWLYSSLSFRATLASFNVHHGVLVLNETVLFCAFLYSSCYMMSMNMLSLCWPQDDQASRCSNDDRLFNSSYIVSVSAVAIISPHLLLPIYSQLLFFSATYTLTMLYATGLSYLFATFSSVCSRLNFFRKLKRPLLCYTHHMIAFLVRHLTISSSGIKGEVWKSFLLPKNVSCLL